MNLPQFFSKYANQIEAAMREVLDDRSLPLYHMMSYHLGWVDSLANTISNGGKPRVLATLCLISNDAAGGDVQKALPAAISMEMVYNSYLIHNDLQDGVPQRDGRDTVWWLWGPAQAINTGDGMHALARQTLFRLKSIGLSDETVFRAVHLLDQSSLKLCEGQFLDISYQERLDVTVDSYLKMIDDRTASLMSCAFKLGPLTALAEDSTIEAFGLFGAKLGMAYQVQKDIKAHWGDDSERSSLSGGVLSKKKTLPVVYGMEKANVRDKRRLGEVYFKRVLEPKDLETIATVLEEIGVREDCQKMAETFYKEAMGALDSTNLSPEAVGALKGVASFLALNK